MIAVIAVVAIAFAVAAVVIAFGAVAMGVIDMLDRESVDD